MDNANINLPISPSIYLPTLNSTARRVVHQGGQWSGKTVNILAVLATKAIQNSNFIITVTSESLPHLKGGAMRDFEMYIEPYVRPWIVQHHKSDNYYLFNNGSIIEFKSYDDEGKARGAKRNILYINEANRFKYLVYFQLDTRSDQTIMDYNPAAPFWAHDSVIGQPGTSLFITDHRHNPFLTEAKHKEIEGIKDPELWRVYARGLTGNLQGLIYPSWTKIPDDQFPWNEPCFGGLDFGYTNDPTAAVRIARVADNVYIHELCYEPGIAPIQLKQLFLSQPGINRDTPIYCEHDPDQVSQLRRLGVLALSARKGPGSINAGIIKMKEYKVFYTASSVNLDEERKRYMWIIDPVTGKPTNTPIDAWNHAMDASRYGVYTHFFRG